MTDEQLSEISKLSGDSIENKLKPGNTQDYLDVYYYWKLRAVNNAGTLEGLEPKAGLMKRETLYKLERIPQYYHSVIARLTKIAIEKKNIRQIYSSLVQNKTIDENIFDSIETFYYFIGSILDNISGLGNIITQNNRGSEDSFNDFLKYNRKTLFTTDEENKLIDDVVAIKDNYRDHLTHRPRLSTIKYINESDRSIHIHIQSEFNKTDQAKKFLTWRKETREIIEGRAKSEPVQDIVDRHFKSIVQACDLIFKKCYECYDEFLVSENLSINQTYNITNPSIQPEGTKFIFYCCDNENSFYLKYWLHDISNPLPTNCTLEYCNSPKIRPIYFLS